MQDTGEPASASQPASAAGAAPAADVADMLVDPDYLASVLGSRPGVDPSDPALQGTLASLGAADKRGGGGGGEGADKGGGVDKGGAADKGGGSAGG
jgi:hypothetical protein